jgi:CIC family chloride channel protein
MEIKVSNNAITLWVGAIIVGLILGITGAITAHYFRYGIHLISIIFEKPQNLIQTFIIYNITLGLAVFLILWLKKVSKSKDWQGPADSIYSVHRIDNELDVKLGFFSTIAAFISAAGGASVGQYGPLVHLGATIGSWLKTKVSVNFSADVFIGAGIAAAISAGFGAPFAGIIFAHEAILRHFAFKALAPIAIASTIAFGTTQMFWPSEPIFEQTALSGAISLMVLVSCLIGPIFGFVAVIFMRSLLFFSSLPALLKLNPNYAAVIMVISLSLIGAFIPGVMGLGSTTLSSLLETNTLLATALLILIGKIIATSISLGFGFFGGVFSPALLIGAAAGAAVSQVLAISGIYVSSGPEIIICGMAAVTGAVIGAPISMTIIVLELTGSYELAMMSLTGIVTAIMFSHHYFGHSYFDKQLLLRNIDLSHGRSGLILMENSIQPLISNNFISVDSKSTVSHTIKLMASENTSEAYIKNRDGSFVGKVYLSSLVEIDPLKAILSCTDHNPISLNSDASLQQAIEVGSDFIGEAIPVLDRTSQKLQGVISESDIFKAYLDLQTQIIDLEHQD